MKKVITLSLLLLFGITLSQTIPLHFSVAQTFFQPVVMYLTMTALSFIMINVGTEFEIGKFHFSSYAWDYLIAMAAAALPWLFVALYFVFVLSPSDTWSELQTWKEMLLLGRFAAPTSAGVLFTMLTAAGLGATWMFHKARILAIFDDLDTVLLLVPLTIMMIGLTWQLGVILAVMLIMIFLGFENLRAWTIPCTWRWILLYAFIIATASKLVLLGSLFVDPETPLHIEVLLPAFLLGCTIKPSPEVNHDSPAELKARDTIAAIFMVLVGLNMPHINLVMSTESESVAGMDFSTIWGHVLVITFVSNLGKMFPLFCYRKEASLRDRLALSIGLFPRGEVGAGVIMISLGYGIGGDVLTIAMFSLTLNLFLTGVFIYVVRCLLVKNPNNPAHETTKGAIPSVLNNSCYEQQRPE